MQQLPGLVLAELILMPSQQTVLTIATWLMIISWMLVVGIGVFTVGARVYAHKQQRKKIAIEAVVTDWLMEYVMMAEDATETELSALLEETSTKIKNHYMGSSFARRVVKAVMLDMNRHVRGSVADALHRLYTSLLFDVLALQTLNYGEWHEQAEAVNELTLMQVPYSLPYIEQHRNHRNKLVRLQTQIAEMKLNENHPLGFLSEVKTPIHAWHQANLYAELSKLPKEKIPSFRPWLQSRNYTVVIFAIKMVRLFNQLDLQPYVLMKSLHPHLEVRREVWQFVSYFHIAVGAELIEHLLPDAEPEMQLVMIECLGNLQTMESEQLLEQVIETDLYGLRIEAALALQRSGYDVLGRWPELAPPPPPLVTPQPAH